MRSTFSSLRVAQRGTSLIELMVALTLGLAVAAVASGFFTPSSGNRQELEAVARMHDNAAYAAELLSDELHVAGYYAEMLRNGITWQVPDPCSTVLADLGWTAPAAAPAPVVGIDAAEAAPACTSSRRAGTDLITLRRLGISAVAAASATGEVPHLQVSNCASDPVAKPFVASTTVADFDLRNRDCATLAVKRPFLVRTYYLSCPNGCPAGGVSQLMRRELTVDGSGNLTTRDVALVDNIENLQFEYGFDTDNNGSPDIYRAELSGAAGAADNDWGNVVAVRFYLVARTDRAIAGYTDQKSFALGLAGTQAAVGDAFKRHLHTAVVRIVNQSGFREKP